MGFSAITRTITRVWQFVDQFASGDNATRADLDTAFNDLVFSINAAIADLDTAIAAAAASELYLGPFSSAPTTNNEGGALVTGNTYVKTPEYQLYVYNTTAGQWELEGQFAEASSYFKGLVGAADAAALRSLLGLGDAAVLSASSLATSAALAAIEEVLVNGQRIVSSAGSGNAFTITATDTITAYAANQMFMVRMDRAPTGAATLNVDGLGAKDINKIDGSNSLVAVASGDWSIGDVIPFFYDGTRFIIPKYGLLKAGAQAPLASQVEAEAGTNNTNLMTPLRTAQAMTALGKVKAWARFNGTGTPALQASYNIASITDNGTGDYTLNFTNAIGSTDYVALTSVGKRSDDRSVFAYPGTLASGSVQVLVLSNSSESSTPTAYDHDSIQVVVLG